MAAFLPLASPIPKKDNRDSEDGDENSNSFQIDYSFAHEYKGPYIANVPRANPVEVDEIPTALPVSFSSLSRGVSYPVVQPFVRTNKVSKKPPESGPEKKNDDLRASDCSNGVEADDEPVNRVKFAVPSEGSECDESSYISDGERSLGKCSRMLKRLLTDSELQQVMSAETSCKANQLPSRLIAVNDKPLSEEELYTLQTCPIPPKKLKPGDYWYDKVAGYWGKVGEKPCQIITPHINIGGSNIRENASNGDTEIFINNRQITKSELMMLKMVGVQCEGKPHFWVDSDGNYQEEGQNRVMGNIWNKKEPTKKMELTKKKVRARLACAVLSLPIPPTSSAVKSNDEDIYKPKMLNKLLLIGNEKCGATTMYKQARSLYEVPFSEEERERIKFIIQTNLYAYLAMILEAHERFEEEMNNNQSSDQTGNTVDEISAQTVSSISPRLKHFSDWLLKEKEEGNLKIFPASSRENAQTVADLWRVPAIQATYKRLRDTLPRNAVYFLGRILEISRSEYEPSDMDILQAEGLSSMEGLSCVEFSFPPTSQEDSLETDYQHDPNMKCQLIRLNPRSLGENWKWLEMFEDADLVIFCVSLTDYGEYIEDGDGVLVNKMIANKQLFESMVTHPSLANKRFHLVLTKFDLLEEKIEEVPLRTCEWFEDFNPLISQNQTSRHNPPMAQRAFHYIGFQFKRLYDSLVGPFSMRGRTFKPKLFVSQVSLESDTVDNALRYAREILKWHVDETSMFQEMSTTSIDASLSS
ncbi:unnamed protein product [Thlaspi arvense]|uniref:Uncharacterized protein n=1 Tax=Thlaspi arvense TaxID=13288 RepID=A0AAU9T097_THLAR|nr:unnamed protein product [Thlaspi arvense]